MKIKFTQSEKDHFSKRTAIFSVSVIILVCLCVLYSNYISGTVLLDRQLISSENLNLIVDNWHKLSESKYFSPWYQSDEILSYTDPNLPENENMRVLFIILKHPDKISQETVVKKADYQRTGLREAFSGSGQFGSCTTIIDVSNERCTISSVFRNAQSNACRFEEIMKQILDLVQH